MNETQRHLLIHNRKLISTDLRADDVFSFLQSKFSLDSDEVEGIRNEKTSKRRTEALLDLILEKDLSSIYINFYNALLYSGYDHLAELLNNGLDTSVQENRSPDSLDEESGNSTVLRDGGVPQRLRIFSQRNEELSLIQQELYKLKNGDACVIVYGMPGIGKTVLASEALRSKSLLDNCFPGGVFWLTIGLSDNSKLLVKAQNLCAWLDDSGNSPLPRNLEESKLRLRLLFRKHHPKSLLVLDDVWSADVMKVFDIRVRLLVTTRDVSIADNQPGTFYKVKLNQGFGIEQARNLLAQYTGIKLLDLPAEANEMINETKGSPLALSMVGSLLQHHPDRWKFYLKKLKDSKLEHIKSKIAYGYRSLHEAFSLSVEALKEDISSKYKDLVVFGEDAKIPKKVLAIYWNVEIEDVEDVMDELVDKSLAYYHPASKDSKVPTYSIHDLQRDILIEYVNKDSDKGLAAKHKKLIERYSVACCGDYSVLPNDTYMIWHIIEHALGAEQNHLAVELLSNLKFVSVKLKMTGAPDVINAYTGVLDLKGLTDDVRTLLYAFRHFISFNSDRFVFQTGFDLIQLGLSQPKGSPVYLKSRQHIASTENLPSALYMDWINLPIAKYEACVLSLSVEHGLGPVYSCHFSPKETDQLMAAAGGASGIIKVFNVSTGAVQHEFNSNSNASVTACRFSPDGTLLASSSVDGTIKIWSLSQPTIPTMMLCGHSQDVTCCQFSPDGLQIISSSLDETVKVWNVLTGKLCYTFDGHDDQVNYCCYSPDGSLILSASNDASVQVWHAATGIVHLICKGENDFFLRCAYKSIGDEVLCVSIASIEIFSADDAAWLRTITTPSTILSLDFTKDGKLLSVGLANTTAEIWDVEEMCLVSVFEGHVSWVNDVSLSPDGKRLLTCSADGTCKVWSVKSPSFEKKNKLTMIYDVSYSNENIVVMAASTNNTLKVFNGSDEMPLWESKQLPSTITCCLILTNAEHVCIGLQSGQIQTIDLSTHTFLHLSAISQTAINNLIMVDDGDNNTMAATTADFTIKIIRIALSGSINVLAACVGHTEGITKCHLLSAGAQLLTSSFDGTIKVWNTSDGVCRLTCSEGNEASHTLTSCSVAKDESVVFASCTDCSVKMWSLSDGHLLHTFEDGFDDAVRSVMCNDLMLAAGTDDSEFKIWNIESRSQVFTITAGIGWVSDICFDSKLNLFLVASDALRWYNTSGQLIQTFHIRGSRMNSISLSELKDAVTTIDDTGQLYVLRQMTPKQRVI